MLQRFEPATPTNAKNVPTTPIGLMADRRKGQGTDRWSAFAGLYWADRFAEVVFGLGKQDDVVLTLVVPLSMKVSHVIF